MLQQIPSAIPLNIIGPLLAMMAFGAYHGLNPGMGWLFALSLALQQQSERAIWRSLLPIALGHALSLLAVAALVIAGARLISIPFLKIGTALVLITFGLFKVFNYYRHPRWVGMQVGMRDLAWWSFLMASAHGAGLMIAPVVLSITTMNGGTDMASAAMGVDPSVHQAGLGSSLGVILGILVHTVAMLAVMALVAWFVYKRFGLQILRSHWINFDLIWAVALLIVGAIALLASFRTL